MKASRRAWNTPGWVSFTPLISRSWRSSGCSVRRASASARATTSLLSGEPALAALVALHIAVALAFARARSGTEVELAHVFVLAQHRRRAVHDDAAAFQYVAVVGVAQCHVGVLLGQQKGHAFLLVQVLHDLEHFLDDLRRQ